MRPRLSDIAARLGHPRSLPDTPGWQARLDSREVRPGDLFVALPGERQDGHAYVAAALAAGAAAVVAEGGRLSADLRGDARVLAVEESASALLELGALARDRHEGLVAAITGSNGKTTTKDLAVQVLSTSRTTAGSRGNQNSTSGAPISLLNELDGQQVYVMEAGMSQPGEIARLCAMARPTHGLITNIQPAHLEGTGGLEAVAGEKGQLFRWLEAHGGTGIVNEDDPLVARQAEILTRRSSWSLRHHRAGALGMEAVDVDGQARHLFRLSGQELRLPVPGQAFLECAAAVCALALELGLGPEQIVSGLGGFSGATGRMSVRRGPGWTLLDDSYNANPASMKAALNTLAQTAATRRVAVLGEMKELGGESATLHREVGCFAAGLALDLVLLVGSEDARAALREGLREGGRGVDGEAASARGLAAAFSPRAGDAVLLKGSRLTGLEALAGEWLP